MDIFLKLYKSTCYSLNGLLIGVQEHASIQLEFGALVLALVACCFLKTTWKETLILLGSIVLVIALELLNSAIEQTCDLISQDYNPLIGKAKDMGSAAVFMGVLIAVGTWIAVLF